VQKSEVKPEVNLAFLFMKLVSGFAPDKPAVFYANKDFLSITQTQK